MILFRAALVATLFTAAAAQAAPTAVAPTADEWKKLEKGEVVTRNAPDLSPPGAYAWVVVEAEPAEMWAVLNDPSQAVEASGSVDSCERYLDEPTPNGRKIGLAYTMTVAFTEVKYSVVRDFRPDAGWMTWTLDPDRTHDLKESTGHYVVEPGKTEGTLLLSYQTQTDIGRNVPTWVTQMLTGRALKGYLEHMKTVAES